MEDDLNLKELLERLKIGIIFIVVIVVIFLLMLTKKFGAEYSPILKKLDKEENLFILVVKTKCDNCSSLKKILKDEQVNYTLLNVDREKYYNTILKRLEITKYDIVEPSLIYIKDNKVYSIEVDLDENKLMNFLRNYSNNME